MTVFTTLPARHDHTPTFTDRLSAPRGESVTLRMHTTLPVTGVGFMVVRSGELEAHAASAVPGRPGWFEYTLTLEQDVTRYAWQLALPDDHVNLTMSGLHRTRRAFRDWFQYLAGYRAPEWAWGSVFYQIFPDRFRNGDETSDVQDGEYEYAGASVFRVPWNTVPDRRGDIHGHYGGDLQGITEKLPYLTELGVNALWLTPIFVSPSNHRYDISDYRQIDPHLGGQAAYDDLLGACRDAGVRVVLDGVFNHVGNENAIFRAALADPAAPQRAMFTWREVNDASRLLPYHTFMDVPTLPKLDYASEATRQEFLAGELSVVRHWLRRDARGLSMDGWRLDVAHMIGSGGTDDQNLELHRELKRAAREERGDAYVFGERFFDAERAMQGDGEDGAMNYHGFGLPLMQWLSGQTHFFMPSRLTGAELAEQLWDAYHALPPQVALNMFNLLDSHDTPRALFQLGGDRVKLRAALTLLMGYPGVPCIYYGTEIGLSQEVAAAMPFCRAPMPWTDHGGDPAAWDMDLRSDVQRLIALRRATPALQRGSMRVLAAQDDTFGYVRELDGVSVAVLASRGAAEPVTVTLPAGEWRDALSGEPVGSGVQEIVLNAGRILISGD
ncbi:alpha-amylase family glycosyl hydrolase [Deinococcus aquiradiocola]|uniref:Alpha-glycosidase n=1 Tax=Deinococcus aquiradiocola TaxID=393059 RepID=A0A917P5R6_9DEIO|nr:alpha-amylase family glycosyl hydrolase [Deinococcus aquiradiocola]GGJ62888.1 alpha-glycosidase [Deinococcus aquiradiocola]